MNHKYKKMIFIILIISTFMHCNNQKNQNKINTSEEIVIQVNTSKSETFDIIEFHKDFNCSIHYIPLETTNESLIGKIKKVYLLRDIIIVFDKKTDRILLFHQDGRFIRQIGQRGQGPDEYYTLNDIFFEESTELIYAHERLKNIIFVFNIEGTIVDRIKPDFMFNSFCKTKDGFWLYTCFKHNNPNGYNLMLVDYSMKKMIGGYFPQHPNFVNVASDVVRFRFDSEGRAYFTYPTSSCVYLLDNAIPKIFCRIDFGNKNAPYNEIAKISSIEEYDIIMENDYFIIGDYHIWNNNLIFSFKESSFNKPHAVFFGYYNNKKSKCNIYRNSKISKELPTTSVLNNSRYYLIYSIFPFELDVDELSYMEKQIGKKLDEEDNPILIICSPKILNY